MIKTISLIGAFVLALTTARAVDPPPDGGHPNQRTAGDGDANLSLTIDADTTATGSDAPSGNTTGFYNAPGNRNWTVTGNLSAVRGVHTATALHNGIVLCGGGGASGM